MYPLSFNPHAFGFDKDINPFQIYDTDFSYEQLSRAEEHRDTGELDLLDEASITEDPHSDNAHSTFFPTDNPTIVARMEETINFMKERGLDVPLFLLYFSWGDRACIQSSIIRSARTALMTSPLLPKILRTWWKPPRPVGSTKPRPQAARVAMEDFAFECVTKTTEKELQDISQSTHCSSDELSDVGLTSFTLEEWRLRLSSPGMSGTPRLWALLRTLSRTELQVERETQRQPDFMIISIIMQVMYSRSQHHNLWQKMISTYLRSQNISAKSLDFLHTLGLTMSHKWTVRAIQTIAENTLDGIRIRLKNGEEFVISHDNLNLAFKVFNQRMNNQSHFDSGTSATIYFQPDAPPTTRLCNRTFQEHRRSSAQQGPLTIKDIWDLERAGAPSRRLRDVYRILMYLFDSPSFNLLTYDGRKHPLLAKPPPVHQLPTGPQYRTEKHVLGTVHIEEASYEGNEKVIMHFLNVLGLIGSTEEKQKLALGQLLVWTGDQLTAERIRGLIASHAWDDNAFERLDFLIPSFGWLHNSMTFAASLHKQYLGTTAGRGLRHAFTVLNRKGLDSVKTRGPFHQQLDEAICHVTEARFQDCWRVVTGADDLAALQEKTPEELYKFAMEILDKLASVDVLEDWDSQDDEEKDEIFRESVLWNRDALRYIDLQAAIKEGDVGVMEDTLPYLLFRYSGGSNSRYAIEILELLHCLQREWPPELKDYVRRRAWLVNLSGHPGKWHPVDQAQEHNIKDQKVTYSMQGPNASWEGLDKIGPAVATLGTVRKHLEKQIRTLRRGVAHTAPSKNADVQRLKNTYKSSKVNERQNGRMGLTESDWVVDVVSEGAIHLFRRQTMSKWWAKRNRRRKTTELWDTDLL
ncbi:hypothetical protein CONPUDRAFT_76987 [Coniophora puteana RWD-64-598 SS2]|uniref:DUF6589 domain-containing protein n=1 Tax=Coniophora puteana (strain RWD-64-598) TaxID=741705 RepID=A0A5M3M9T4_CONPW|nr:uncharacterized protein CONPUDRAFT_76987 [Coniophora puteana RWD-64-598 SS2]EIW75949.1 hypothetical protein CONPUDRAFT_76987 [Coniophora puteana RWD-64-598 SS2]